MSRLVQHANEWSRGDSPAGWGRFRLPQHEQLRERAKRASQLHEIRAQYAWKLVPGLPSTLVEMPERERFDKPKRRAIQAGFVGAGLRIARVAPRVMRSRWRSLAVFEELAPARRVPKGAHSWRSDACFARQRLLGVNPLVIARCEQLPERLGLAPSALERLLPPDTRLEAELEQGRLFVCDYACLDGLPCIEGRFLPAPIGLFHQAPRGPLLPLAIQLGQDPSQDGVFTPASAPLDWLAARTYLASADGHHHQFVNHLLRMHYQPEPFVIATRRQLHPRHPIHELLAPHFRWLFAINEIARSQAASDRGSFGRMKSTGMLGGEVLMRREHARPFTPNSILDDLETRGLRSREHLPGYWFRDDVLVLHAAIQAFVRLTLERIYPNAESLTADLELQAWAAELVDPQRGRVRGLPGAGRIETRTQLEHICVELIFVMSALHTAVSHGQYDQYVNAISSPHGLRGEPMRRPGEMSEARLMQAVPKQVALDQLGASIAAGTEPLHTLLHPRETQWAGAPELMQLRAAFGRQLACISADIQARNRSLEHPYEALDPRVVGEGVTV